MFTISQHAQSQSSFTNTSGANARALLYLFGIQEDSCGRVIPREADFQPKVVGIENTVLYPNPTTGILHINSELLHFDQPLIISILKTDGSIISIYKNEANMSIDISDLPNGLYFVRINDKVSTSTYKVIKL